MEGGAYGAGRAGTPFSPLTFIKRPQVIVRLAALLFAVIVFSCISSRGYARAVGELCLYDGDMNACHYGVGIGVIAFMLCIAFLVLDAMFEQISSVQNRKYAVMADIGVSALWCFLWFVGFCYLTDKWRKSAYSDTYGKSDAEAAISFMFFSILAWGGLVALAIMRYRKGVTEDFGMPGQTRPDIAQSSNPYASFGGEADQSYQQAPFSTAGPQAPAGTYQPPTY